MTRADDARATDGVFQILTLEPLEGPWCDAHEPPMIVRFDGDVRPAPHDGIAAPA